MDRIIAAKVFADIAVSGSFTATAERLEMSRAMVTRYVEAMEQWLQVRLLHRTTRQVTLTSAGERCLAEVEPWLQQASLLEASAAQSDKLHGKIRIAVSMSFAYAQLMPALSGFMAQHPHLEIDLDVEDSTADLVAKRIDLAIRIASVPDSALIGKPIAKCDSVLVAAPDYLAQYGAPTTPQQLAQHRCLGYKNFERHVWHLQQGEQHEAVAVHCALSANEATCLLRAAECAMGIALQPRYLVATQLAKGQLVELLPQWRPKQMQIYALYSSRQFLSPAIRQLIDYLSDYFAQAQWQQNAD